MFFETRMQIRHLLVMTATLSLFFASLLAPHSAFAEPLQLQTAAAPLQSGNSPATAITGVTVVHSHREAVVPAQTVWIKDGRILDMRPSADLHSHEGYEVFDGSGKFLVAGYVDSHAHFPGTEADDIPVPLYLQMMAECGVTRLRCMRYVESLPKWRDEIAAGRVVGPMLHYPVALLSKRENLSEDHLKATFKEASEQKGAFVKMLGGFPPKTYQRLMDLARANGIKVAGHLPFGVELDLAIQCGQIGIEHFHGFDRKQKLPLSELNHRIAQSGKAGIYHCPTIFWNAVQGGHLSTKQLDSLDGVTRMPAQVLEAWRASLADPQQDHWRKPMKPNRPLMIRILKHMAAADGNLLISASAGEFVIHGHSFHEEIKIYQEAEMTPFQILQASTFNAAKFFDATDQWGSVQAGLQADLVLLNSNPLDSAANLKDIAAVWIQGRRVDVSE